VPRRCRDVQLEAEARIAERSARPSGYLGAVLPDYLRYYRRDFHPSEADDTSLIAAAEQTLAALTGLTSAA
jgi:predicted metal-dependent hydrolase